MGAYLRYFAIGIIIVLVLLALVLAALDRRSAPRSGASEISFSQLLNEVDANRVRSIVIDVSLERPRNVLELRNDPRYGQIVYGIWGHLKDEVERARL